MGWTEMALNIARLGWKDFYNYRMMIMNFKIIIRIDVEKW
jgi:hypothetical protein